MWDYIEESKEIKSLATPEQKSEIPKERTQKHKIIKRIEESKKFNFITESESVIVEQVLTESVVDAFIAESNTPDFEEGLDLYIKQLEENTVDKTLEEVLSDIIQPYFESVFPLYEVNMTTPTEGFQKTADDKLIDQQFAKDAEKAKLDTKLKNVGKPGEAADRQFAKDAEKAKLYTKLKNAGKPGEATAVRGRDKTYSNRDVKTPDSGITASSVKGVEPKPNLLARIKNKIGSSRTAHVLGAVKKDASKRLSDKGGIRGISNAVKKSVGARIANTKLGKVAKSYGKKIGKTADRSMKKQIKSKKRGMI